MPTYIVLLASKDPEFPLGENRHSHHAHLAFRTVAHLYSSRSERETTLSSPLREERLSLLIHHVCLPRTYAPFLFLPVCVSLLAHAPLVSSPSSMHTPHQALPFFSPRLCSLAAPLLLFGSVSSPRDRESLRGERRG